MAEPFIVSLRISSCLLRGSFVELVRKEPTENSFTIMAYVVVDNLGCHILSLAYTMSVNYFTNVDFAAINQIVRDSAFATLERRFVVGCSFH